MQPDVREIALGRWQGILTALGVDASHLTGKHTACPVCGGKDRFRFDDKGGRGTWYCSSCEPRAGDGFNLLMNITGESFKQSAAKVRDVIAFVPENRICSHRPDIEQQIRRILIMTKRLRPDDDAHRYLTSRGITRMPMIGLHPGMPYWDGQKSLGVFPVMIASSRNTEGTIVALHRTYLQDGRKAPVPNPKKSIGPILGTALRLYPAADIMGVAEGIETACAASKLFHMPTWAALNAGEMERFTPDPIVKELHIFADNDASFTGQMAANKLAHRLSLSGLHCFVHVPDAVGTDWADEVAK